MRKIRTLTIAAVLSLLAASIGIFLYFAPAQFANVNRTMDFVVVNEAMLWADDQDWLHKIGVRFPQRQAFNPHLKLVIQYEGAHHNDEAQRLRDALRDRAFREAGWTIILVRVDDLRDDFRAVLRRIRAHLASAAA